MQWSLWHDISAIGLFKYLTKWWYREYGGHLNACPGRLEGITEACPGGMEQNTSVSRGWNKIEACPGGHL